MKEICNNCLHFDEVLSGHKKPSVLALVCIHLTRDINRQDKACVYYLGKDIIEKEKK